MRNRGAELDRAVPGLEVVEDPRRIARVLFVAADLVRIEPPLLPRLGLPHGEELVDVGVQEEDERILEGRVQVEDVGARPEEEVCRIVRAFEVGAELGPLLELRERVGSVEDRRVGRDAGRRS